jgi:threonine/homoserine/homoserine lactone efflux protein
LFFAAVSRGAQSGAKAGLVFSIAHTLIEFTLVMLLACGLLTVVSEPGIKLTVGVVGGIALVGFGAMQILDSLKAKSSRSGVSRVTATNLLIVGLVFTGLNPFFIVWCLTVGAKLILLSLEFASLAGVVLMYVCHVWMDYLWLTSVAHFSKRSVRVLGLKGYRLVMGLFGGILVYFGITFLINTLGA